MKKQPEQPFNTIDLDRLMIIKKIDGTFDVVVRPLQTKATKKMIATSLLGV